MKKYDYLVVGAGLFGSVFAYEMKKRNKTCLVIEKRDHIGGNVYTYEDGGINVHAYGAHIFHTSDKYIWDYVNSFAVFNDFVNSPVADYYGERYHLPFNMNTFVEMWPDVKTAADAKKKIASQTLGLKPETATNLEEKAISLVGTDVYTKLIKGYTEKQWGKPCKELPPFIIERLPVRFTFDNNYFNDRYQGIPVGGYTQIIEKMLDGVEVSLLTDYKTFIRSSDYDFGAVIYTGTIDGYFDCDLGELEYRSLRFETEKLPIKDLQGNAVVNYTDEKSAYTRIIEHKHFEKVNCDHTIITREYPKKYVRGDEPYYPVNDEKNNALYEQYRDLAAKEFGVYFCGRLGSYGYFDMDKTIMNALALVKELSR